MSTPNATTFDDYADSYNDALESGLVLTGEDKSYYIRERLAWVNRALRSLKVQPREVLDFGCGCGDTCPYFFEILGVKAYTGIDVSSESIRLASHHFADLRARFVSSGDWVPEPVVDFAYCNGVFHHIEPRDRDRMIRSIASALLPGGILAFWENNPLNLGTRWVMSRIPFDRDAKLIFAHSARRMLRQAGFEILSTTYRFIFPRVLRAARPLEPFVCRVPIGGQYQILARRLVN